MSNNYSKTHISFICLYYTLHIYICKISYINMKSQVKMNNKAIENVFRLSDV